MRPGGTIDNSPAIHRWEGNGIIQPDRPAGTMETATQRFSRPSGTGFREARPATQESIPGLLSSVPSGRNLPGRATDRMNAVTTNTPEMIEMGQKALELRAKGIIKF